MDLWQLFALLVNQALLDMLQPSKFRSKLLRTNRAFHFKAFFVARCARFIKEVIAVLGCFFFNIFSCLDNSLLYLLRLRRFGLGSGTSAPGAEVMSEVDPFAERTRSMSASYSSKVIVTVAKEIPPGIKQIELQIVQVLRMC